ncbi:phage late control D family protein [Paenibacillus melissococcoides]|uniref:Phage late control D family protein n=1 Tax=Paenibacillus melissococcoides TaxID=2912268 RepID=A0ABN8U0H8_9BACL|nr:MULTISPECIES: contractile injection system protein, VgrG/Pvc8 family [Paenibacillus]MEB9892337.1 contractile injection system protein, VgrG/Pvc8 family [Bacillus cereus]CAH8244559.1 phage late control D family protein [Paenibacillus melissococcoides]CAH8708342.1 phage late control D family protein [Paenibacillus melissococcoides]CAH8709050.1 phage late control D family protein [Paenibacillus melissococcoides]GIO78402.1 hypothetical protein J6TS7_20120 [Paenibacillus dendritiformis]
MSQSALTYQNLQITPYRLVNLQELKLTKKINEHTRLRFTGIVPEELKDSYVEMTDADTTIELSQINEEGESKPLFSGIVLHIGIKAVRDIYYLEVEAVSHSYKLDVKRKSRSFQNKAVTIPMLLDEIASDYPGMDVVDEATDNARLGRFTVQYQETDWQFLKRMASRFHTSLMPTAVFDRPKFYFGICESNSQTRLEDYHYTVRKRMNTYRYFAENDSPNVDENDFIYYEVETDRVLELGSWIGFKGKSLYVCEALTEVKNGLLTHQYVLCLHKGLRQKILYNRQIKGASLQGKVIDVAKDKVKVHLDIDKKQDKGEAHWFPYTSVYTAEGHSGWYVMPEIGDTVRIYFPSEKEEEGVASSSIRQDLIEGETNKVGNPNIKYFRTAAGKEVKMSPDEIVITGKDGAIYIKLNENNGIHIISNKNIMISAQEDIMMDSQKKVIISAGQELNLSCKSSSIHLSGNTNIVGSELKTN